jgi:hypothetical protein
MSGLWVPASGRVAPNDASELYGAPILLGVDRLAGDVNR